MGFDCPSRPSGALRREGKGIYFVETEGFLRRVDALPSRFALAGHDSIDF
jgi:hypothetical protein